MNHSNSSPSPGDSDYTSDSAASQQKTGRPLADGGDLSAQQVGGKKNSNVNNYQMFNEGVTFFKILVPSMAAGAIIGKGGETIAMLQQETQTRIKMSKATDYFPGTNERVCIVYGPSPDGILQVHDFIAQKIREKPDSGAKSAIDFDSKQPAEREKQVKILVPNSTAGMIIGKGGNYIKYIKEESGAYVQISQIFYGLRVRGISQRKNMLFLQQQNPEYAQYIIKVQFAALGVTVDSAGMAYAACGNAGGTMLRPLILFDGKVHIGSRFDATKDGCFIGVNAAGVMDNRIFTDRLNTTRDIKAVCLPAGQTDKLQPLDKSVFGPVKNHWRDFLRYGYTRINEHKAKDHAITERCITIIGDLNQNRKACKLILAKIFEDPQSNSCPNLSYADIVGPVPNYNPTGSPFANMVHGAQSHGQLEHAGMPAFAGNYGNPNQFFSNLRSTLRLSGYSDEATNEIIAAMSTLAHYGILGLGLGLGGLNMNMGYMSPMSGLNGNGASGYVHSTGSSLASGLSSSSMGGSPGGYSDGTSATAKSGSRFNGQDSLDSSYSSQYDHLQQGSPVHQLSHNPNENWGPRERWGPIRTPHLYANNGISGNESDAAVPGSLGENTRISIEINENLVGALLGREGKTITEIESMCGTQIQVTPKKKFSQGRRAVTIVGTPNAVQMTQVVINQRLAQAEEKRSQNDNQSSSNNSSPQQQVPLSPSAQFS